jgi:hypothetical protein
MQELAEIVLDGILIRNIQYHQGGRVYERAHGDSGRVIHQIFRLPE